ncbi:hypothetical protein QCA50_007806 [Cerrena zonata]|uniref:Methyltransferase ausD n=1 Tax=Cerrena zonata TaxID=2478898 RepID=A0AAW0G6N7_9APHY
MGSIPSLDEKYYSLKPDEAAFFKAYTGIEDDDELKKHITKVQTEAYAVHPYGCIRHFSFTKLIISRYPAYSELLRIGKERPGAFFLDLGCCFGSDVRKVVADGFPVRQALASDIHPEFWDLGYKLFRDSKDIFPVTFIPGDILDNQFLTHGSSKAEVTTVTDSPSLSSLTNLTPLSGRLSVIHTSLFFHLFDEEQQAEVARKLGSLLSAEPGSIIFGAHGGSAEKGFRPAMVSSRSMFYHSPESWVNLWEKEVFEEGQVRAWAILREVETPELVDGALADRKWHLLVWSVTRL